MRSRYSVCGLFVCDNGTARLFRRIESQLVRLAENRAAAFVVIIILIVYKSPRSALSRMRAYCFYVLFNQSATYVTSMESDEPLITKVNVPDLSIVIFLSLVLSLCSAVLSLDVLITLFHQDAPAVLPAFVGFTNLILSPAVSLIVIV